MNGVVMWNLLDDLFAIFTMWKTEKETEPLYQETTGGLECPAFGQPRYPGAVTMEAKSFTPFGPKTGASSFCRKLALKLDQKTGCLSPGLTTP